MKGFWNARRQKGFTLVELLVVIAIIGILATLVLLQLGTARGRARDTKRIADVAQIRSAVEQYYEDHNGLYPPNATWAADIKDYFSSGTTPKDPLTDTAYTYCLIGVTGYQVAADLEQKAAALNSDSDLNPGAAPCVDGRGTAAGGVKEACTNVAGDCIYDVGTK
jgi:prepilin-type N-terminal cleavage/methylation domain-containing protein